VTNKRRVAAVMVTVWVWIFSVRHPWGLVLDGCTMRVQRTREQENKTEETRRKGKIRQIKLKQEATA
jgi:hypothetical protein